MKIFFPLIICCMLASCSKWIDVKPADRLSGEMLFQDREGYLKALNGVYVEMANTSLYGQDMTAGVLDVLAAEAGSVSDAAKRLGISTGNLSAFLTEDEDVYVEANRLRATFGLKPLRRN